MPSKKRERGKGDGSYRVSVPPVAAEAAGSGNPTSLKAMEPKGRSAASPKGGGRKLRGR